MRDQLLRALDAMAAIGWLWIALDTWTPGYQPPVVVRVACYASTGLLYVFREW